MRNPSIWVAVGLLAIGGIGAANAERIGTDALREAVEIAHQETYEPGYGSVVTVGIVESTTDRLLERLRMGLIIRDAAGEELGRESAEISLLAPGGWATFRSVFKEPDYPEWDSIEPVIWRAEAHPRAMTPSLDASVESETADPAGNSYIHEVRGSVINTDDRTLEWVGVQAAFFDADDRLVAVGFDNASRDLGAGESASFHIGINTAGGDVARTDVHAIAEPVDR